jgi:hypothetical protein
MRYPYSREALVGIWVLVFASAGVLASVNSLSAWLVLSAVAAMPALVFLRVWGHQPQTMSESIQQARR